MIIFRKCGGFDLKKTEYVRKMNRDERRYRFVKLIKYLHMKVSFGKKKKTLETIYSMYEKERFFRERDNSLPEQYYFKPTDIVLYDLLAKESLGRVRQGILKLYKRCTSRKFLTGGRSVEEIDEIINGLDQQLNSGYAWYRVGAFDFAYKDDLDTFIDFFEVRVYNFSSSYAAVEMRVRLSETFVNEMAEFICKQYNKTGVSIHSLVKS